MAVIRKELVRGVTLNVIGTDKFKSNYFSVNFITPLESATAALNALLPRVLGRGTVNYPTMAKLSERLDYLYATNLSPRVYKRGETQVFGFSSYALDNAYSLDGTDILEGAVGLMGEVIFSPLLENGSFKREYVESEKKNLIDSIKAKINDKRSYAIRRCQEEMCAGEAFGIPESGTVEEVSAITPETLYEHYRKVIRNSKVEIFYVGRGDADALRERFAALFTEGQESVPTLVTEVKRRADAAREVVEDQPVSQGKLSIGFRTGSVLSDGDYHIFTLFSELYGGSPTSKLFMNVREKLSLCYYCRSIPEAQKGIMVVASGIEVDKYEEAKREILDQLENVRNGVFTDEELDSAKNSLINAYRELTDSPSALEGWYMGRMLAGIDNSPEEAAGAVSAVTREQIAGAARGVTLDTVYFMRGTLKGEGGEDEADE